MPKWLSATLVLVLVIVAIFAFLGRDHRVAIGSKDEVLYSGNATEQDAKALGAALQKEGYFTDKGVSVLLAKGDDGTIVSFVVQDGFWTDQTHVDGYSELGRSVAGSVGGFPIKVRMTDDHKNVKKEVTLSAPTTPPSK